MTQQRKHQQRRIPSNIRRISAVVALAFSASAPFAAHAGTPYSGTPVALPATFEAENFDKGGEGQGYDLSRHHAGRMTLSTALDTIRRRSAIMTERCCPPVHPKAIVK